MTTPDFSNTILVDASPSSVFNAINNVKGWWSQEVEGGTSNLNDVFHYHFRDVHTCTMKLIEVIENQKVVWEVLDNHFSFTKDKNEWKGNKIIFEISEKDGQTELVFTHKGLVPEYECYDICNNAWTEYIQNSLKSLITAGKGQPNSKEENLNFTTTILVDKTPMEAFNAINNVKGWWTENLEGDTEKLNDAFEVRFGDVHYSKQKLEEVITGEKVVWLITDSTLSFIEHKAEWTGTRIVFDLTEQHGKTQVRFTQEGLIPTIECFGACSTAWTGYIQESLKNLISTGKGEPTPKEG